MKKLDWIVLKLFFCLSLLFSPYIQANTSWTGLIGVDYQPNHYPQGHVFNFRDVFIVTNKGDTPITNVYLELSQLKAAGFNTVRSYQTTAYSWIDLINQAHALGMNIVYEAVIPQTGSDSDITTATNLLNKVINAVSTEVFNNTVILVLAGHENYCDNCAPGGTSNIDYLTKAVSALQGVVPTIPVSSAVVSGNLVTPPKGHEQNITALVNSYTPSAPLGFDPYPFQWGVPVDQAVNKLSVTSTENSIGYDYKKVMNQTSFYTPPRTILMAESGWASAGTTNPHYFCGTKCKASVTDEVTYLSTLYNFVKDPANNSALLVFEAYDEPAKEGSSSMEDYYGVFDQNCKLKGPNNTKLLPNTAFSPANNLGCEGFANGSLLTIVGYAHPYTLIIQQKNPITGKESNIKLSSDGKPGPLEETPWPTYLVFPGATIGIEVDGKRSCTSTIQSINASQQISFSGTCNCPNDNKNNCYF